MSLTPEKNWFVYLVRAANGALYCGISDDPQRRFAQHLSGKGARFFFSSPAVALVYSESCTGKGDALRRERAIKRLGKGAKEALVATGSLMHALDEQPPLSVSAGCGRSQRLSAPEVSHD